ncbi:hypothetical protein AG1IA_00860 [Rhizoctonia solani AG-1 IA]|uniref:Uncharacterized protein n=1 Tax=Thanatephorus cucumeris (strain AG1-IA) TaxID=983506 RepID=L8X8X8_THACA|nr:hypothetical protein AG1IA_00860 [Rhizoctonia solani AG-1 IA]
MDSQVQAKVNEWLAFDKVGYFPTLAISAVHPRCASRTQLRAPRSSRFGMRGTRKSSSDDSSNRIRYSW